MTEVQLKTLRRYYKELISESYSEESVLSYLHKLKKYGEFVKKPFEKVKSEDFRDFVVALREGKITKYNKPATLNYINGFKIVLKVFYKKLLKIESNSDPFFRPLKIKRQGAVKTASDVLNQEEIKQLVNSTDNYRDRALIHCLYESGLRKSEFMNLKIKDIRLNSKYAEILSVNGKTGFRDMPIPLITSHPDIITLLNSHPMKDDPESPLFVNLDKNNTGLGVYGLNDSLRKYQKKTGLKKKCYPHIFRHSRLTHLGELGFSEMELRIFAGWTAQSPMASVYCHIKGKSVSNKILGKNGIKTEESEQQKKIEKTLKQVECPRCNTTNSAGMKYCGSCGSIIDIKTAIEEQKAIKFSSDIINTTFKQKGGITRDLVKEAVKDLIKAGEITL